MDEDTDLSQNGPPSTDIESLRGLTIHEIAVMPAEIERRCGQYLLIQGTDASGERVRIMLGFVSVPLPAPHDVPMSQDRMAGGTQFFTEEEVFTRRRGDSLFPAGGKRVPPITIADRLEKTPWRIAASEGDTAEQDDGQPG